MSFIIGTILVILFCLFLKKNGILFPIGDHMISRKKRMLIMVVCVTLVIFVVSILFLDRKLYYNGKSNLCIYDELPFKISPDYWGYGNGDLGFVLQKDGADLIGKGVSYQSNPSITVNEITEYGFNDSLLLARVYDSQKNRYTVICSLKKNDRNAGELEFKIISDEKLFNYNNLVWITINDFYTNKIKLARNYLELFFLCLVLLFMWLLITRTKPLSK